MSCGQSSGAPHTGTTVVACTYEGGVVLAADGRVSMGKFICSRASSKIAPLTDNVFLLRSGSAADAQIISDYVSHYACQMETELGQQATVKSVANLVRQMEYHNKSLVGANIVGGFDKELGGQIYGCPIGGTISEEKWATDGSGSTYIWGYLDAAYRPDFTREEAQEFVKEAVALAMSSDSSSGGIIRLVTVTEAGAEHKYIPGEEIPNYRDAVVPPTQEITPMQI